MIRKTIIVVSTLLAAGTYLLALASTRTPLFWPSTRYTPGGSFNAGRAPVPR